MIKGKSDGKSDDKIELSGHRSIYEAKTEGPSQDRDAAGASVVACMQFNICKCDHRKRSSTTKRHSTLVRSAKAYSTISIWRCFKLLRKQGYQR